jgi:L-threonylcarbamoyladenylate synthase
MTLTEEDALALQECIAAGGVAVFPADTVYGLACDPTSSTAIARLYELKGRPEQKPCAVLFGSLDGAAPTLQSLRDRTAAAARALLPGPVTLLLANRERRYPLACDPSGADPEAPLGVRVPAWPDRLASLHTLATPLMQSSANISGEPPALRLSDVAAEIRSRADLLLDGGELPGIASTIVDLRRFEEHGDWRVMRAGALSEAGVALRLAEAASG